VATATNPASSAAIPITERPGSPVTGSPSSAKTTTAGAGSPSNRPRGHPAWACCLVAPSEHQDRAEMVVNFGHVPGHELMHSST
jgi:hypothetical protein